MFPRKPKRISTAIPAVLSLCLVSMFPACSDKQISGTDEQENTVAVGGDDNESSSSRAPHSSSSKDVQTTPDIPSSGNEDIIPLSSSSLSISPSSGTSTVSSSSVADDGPAHDPSTSTLVWEDFVDMATTGNQLNGNLTDVEGPIGSPITPVDTTISFKTDKGEITYTLEESKESISCENNVNETTSYKVTVSGTFVNKVLNSGDMVTIDTFEQSCYSESGRFITTDSESRICSLELSRTEQPDGNSSYTDPSWSSLSQFIIDDCQ